MAKIYVAGKNLQRARSVMEMLRKEGHAITYDWIVGIENETDSIKKSKAFDEREGVRKAEVLVYLWESDQESARYETGMAMGLGIPVIVSGKHESFFFLLPEVVQVKKDESIIGVLGKIKPK
jgi:hypothetical protein